MDRKGSKHDFIAPMQQNALKVNAYEDINPKFIATKASSVVRNLPRINKVIGRLFFPII